MTTFPEQDYLQIKNHHLTTEQVNQQITDFKNGFPFINIVSAAITGDGILQISDTKYAEYYDNEKDKYKILDIKKSV